MEFDGWVIANLVTIVIFFITVGYYKGKVDTITKDNETLQRRPPQSLSLRKVR